MSDRLTAARLDLIHEMFDLFAPDNLVLESEAGDLLDRYAARAVEEALSVVKGWLTTIGVDIDGNRCLCESRYAPWDGIHRPDCMWERAAALVAHVRGS